MGSKKKQLSLKVGDKVWWLTRGLEKHGTIVASVPAGKDPWGAIVKNRIKKSRVMFAGGVRDKKSYVVSVPRTGHKGKDLTPYLYWPNPKNLSTQKKKGA